MYTGCSRKGRAPVFMTYGDGVGKYVPSKMYEYSNWPLGAQTYTAAPGTALRPVGMVPSAPPESITAFTVYCGPRNPNGPVLSSKVVTGDPFNVANGVRF